MRGTIEHPEIKDNKVNCPNNCGKTIDIKKRKCVCGVRIRIYRKKGRIIKITWCGPSNSSN